MTGLVFVVPDHLTRPTGGNRYDQALAAALTALGTPVELRMTPGSWPVAAPADRARLATHLSSSDPVLVDGLLACGAPDEVDAAVARGGPVHVLVHMPLALDTGLSAPVASSRDVLERAALRAATTVVATSEWTAAHLRARHGLAQVTVATPGAVRAPLARGSDPPQLLHVAAVTPVKNQLTLVDSLALLTGTPWTAKLTGSLDADPAYAAAVRARIAQHGLTGRIRLTGPLADTSLTDTSLADAQPTDAPMTDSPLARVWETTDVLVLPSRAETWGMVVTEALARGIPAVVSRGTGAEEALGRAPDGELPGALADPRSPPALAAAIRAVLGSDRHRARQAARARRATLPDWTETAIALRKALL